MSDFLSTNKTSIEKFIEFTKKMKDDDKDYLKYNLEVCAIVLSEMINKDGISPFGFDKNCSFTIEHIGKNFIEAITASSYDTNTYEKVVIFLIRMVKEYELKSSSELTDNTKLLLTLFSHTSNSYSEELNSQIYYTFNRMPFRISEDSFNKKLAALNSTISQTVKDTVTSELPKETTKIEALKDYIDKAQKVLDGQKEKFSFVLLNKAFSKLEESKVSSKNLVLFILTLLAIATILIPYFYYKELFYIKEITEAYNVLFKTKINISESNSSVLFLMLVGLIPMILIETLCIYFFKIALHKYNSLVDQIVQLETKQAIVQFIESYVDYKKDKKLTHEELAKFEEIVFSKISPNLKDIPGSPSVISLIEGIAKAIKK